MAKDLSVETEKRREAGDPVFRPLGLLRDDIDVAFDRMFSNWPFQSRALDVGPFAGTGIDNTAVQPRVDVSEADDKFEIAAEVPGVDEKDISLTIKDDLLTLKGEKRVENEEKREGYHRVERSSGSFHRAFRLPFDVDSDNVKAAFKNGVLTVAIAKPAEEQIKSRAGAPGYMRNTEVQTAPRPPG